MCENPSAKDRRKELEPPSRDLHNKIRNYARCLLCNSRVAEYPRVIAQESLRFPTGHETSPVRIYRVILGFYRFFVFWFSDTHTEDCICWVYVGLPSFTRTTKYVEVPQKQGSLLASPP